MCKYLRQRYNEQGGYQDQVPCAEVSHSFLEITPLIMQKKSFCTSLTFTFPQLYAQLPCCFCGLTYSVFTGAESKTIYKLRTEGELSVLRSRRDVLIFSFLFFPLLLRVWCANRLVFILTSGSETN